jgi:RES domain-containing protein
MVLVHAAEPGRIWDLPQHEAMQAVTDRLARVRRKTVRGTVHRALYAKYLLSAGTDPKPLYYEGSLGGRRFTPRMGPAGLYLSFDPATPQAELRTVVFADGVPAATSSHDPIITVAVRCAVHRILDLTDPETREILSLTRADLRSDWEREQDEYLAGRAPMPATQLLALTGHASGLFAGIKYPSARTDFGVNLVVFPDRLRSSIGDVLEAVDSDNRFFQRLPP